MKAARIVVIIRLKEDGFIGPEMSMAEIGRRLGVNRSTILRDMREVAVIDGIYRDYLARWTMPKTE